jgi:hypothetical protein
MRSISRGLLLALALTFVATAAHATKYGVMTRGADRRFAMHDLVAKVSAPEGSHTAVNAKLTSTKPAPATKTGVLKSMFHIGQ